MIKVKEMKKEEKGKIERLTICNEIKYDLCSAFPLPECSEPEFQVKFLSKRCNNRHLSGG